ncbi:phospholipase a-2-activating protein [Anaeramoeba flamelloides]|uniref:Phospholipase a-2-activating protein n=1 Tax=Anaeramoeba flamelloides TaxID=1746091 RepID=A0AAV7ZLG1_9EUKA|nr:phospholipase a-2-activating protein [Anaeramoeba flamelloides]
MSSLEIQKNTTETNQPKTLKIEKNFVLSGDYCRFIDVDEEFAYVSNFGGQIFILPLETFTKESSQIIKAHTNYCFQVYKYKGMLVSCSGDSTVKVTDPNTKKCIRTFEVKSKFVFETLIVENRIFCCGRDNFIMCWNYETGKVIKKINTEVNFLSMTKPNDYIFISDTNGHVNVLDIEKYKIIHRFKVHENDVQYIINKNNILYTIGNHQEKNIKSWDCTTYKELKPFIGHEKGQVVIKTKWNYLFSAGYDHTIKIWDLDTHKCLFSVLTGGNIWCLDLNHKYIVAGYEKSILTINIEDQLQINSNNDFLKLKESQFQTDLIIHEIPVHESILKIRTGKSGYEVKKVLEKSFTKEEAEIFLEWIYGKNLNLKKIEKIANAFQIENIQKKSMQQDLMNAYNDEDSKDFYIVVKDLENEEYNEEDEEEEEEEIPVHKFILIAKCGLFRNFFENVKEETKKVQDYSGKSIETLDLFIKFLYTSQIELTADDDPQLIIEELEDAHAYYQLNKFSNLDNLLKKLKRQFNLN